MNLLPLSHPDDRRCMLFGILARPVLRIVCRPGSATIHGGGHPPAHHGTPQSDSEAIRFEWPGPGPPRTNAPHHRAFITHDDDDNGFACIASRDSTTCSISEGCDDSGGTGAAKGGCASVDERCGCEEWTGIRSGRAGEGIESRAQERCHNECHEEGNGHRAHEGGDTHGAGGNGRIGAP